MVGLYQAHRTNYLVYGEVLSQLTPSLNLMLDSRLVQGKMSSFGMMFGWEKNLLLRSTLPFSDVPEIN